MMPLSRVVGGSRILVEGRGKFPVGEVEDRPHGRRRSPARLALASLLALVCAGCAAPFQRPVARPSAPDHEGPGSKAVSVAGRPAVGVALGGGSARGIAHVGVIRWLEEHRIPIDVAAGTSMGGLVGGAFATGMDARELEAFINSLDWDQLFGASSFAHKNIRRKADGRAYPSRLEFGLKGGGIVPPTALNNGENVELLLGRITAPYFNIEDFDALPTPFRTVAVDLLSAQPVVMRSGSLADAMRATMSLPLIFPPVEVDGRVLIDGGTMNNVPADVVKAMGADRVIAVNVGDLSDREGVSYTMFGLAGSTIDAMMRASTRRALASADVVINVPLEKYGSLDWRRSADLIEEGYRAAEAMRDRLLPLAVSEAEYEAWRAARQGRRRTELPPPAFLQLDGFATRDAARLNVLLARHVGAPLDTRVLEQDIAVVAGLDRYQTVTWQLMQTERGVGLRIRGRLKPYAPPFMMLGVNLENTTSSDFRIALTARYLSFDVLGSGSELRIDGTIGSDPSAAVELYRPIGPTPLFVAPYAGVRRQIFDFIEDDAVIAQYRQTVGRLGLNAGVNLGATSDVRIGAYVGRSTASIEVGDPGFPELRGSETGAELVWRMDTQDRPVVPSLGLLSEVRLSRVFNGPDVAVGEETFDFNSRLTQLSAVGNHFWSLGAPNRVFVYGGVGTSFDSQPLPTQQFALGSPFRLGAYSAGELRGAHYYVATAGYLRQIGRLPDFMGGPVFAGTWLENGDAFEEWDLAGWRTNGGAGLVLDTLVGPVILAGSWGFDGRWRTYLGVGRIFR
jgi:NTE family protein